MNSANKFRVAALVVSALLAVYAVASFFSEVFLPRQPSLPADLSKITPQAVGPDWATSFSPFRTDLEATQALALALMAIRRDTGVLSAADAKRNAESQEEIKRVLRDGPHRSDLWL